MSAPRRPARLAGLLVALCALLAPAARAQLPDVVADIAPVHSLVARVMRGVGAPRLLIPRDRAPADWQPDAQAMRLLGGARLVFMVGRQLTPGLARPHALLARKVYFIELSEVPGLPLPAPAVAADGVAEVSPQYWLNPEIARLWLPVIADALAEVDPANAPVYRGNATDAWVELEMLERAVAERLRHLAVRGHAVPDERFAHFEHAFHLARAAMAGADALASADALERLRARGVRCVILAPGMMTPALAERITRAELGAAVLDEMGAGLELGPGLYVRLIERLAEGFARCLGG